VRENSIFLFLYFSSVGKVWENKKNSKFYISVKLAIPTFMVRPEGVEPTTFRFVFLLFITLYTLLQLSYTNVLLYVSFYNISSLSKTYVGKVWESGHIIKNTQPLFCGVFPAYLSGYNCG